jgi:hypothetical protein
VFGVWFVVFAEQVMGMIVAHHLRELGFPMVEHSEGGCYFLLDLE